MRELTLDEKIKKYKIPYIKSRVSVDDFYGQSLINIINHTAEINNITPSDIYMEIDADHPDIDVNLVFERKQTEQEVQHCIDNVNKCKELRERAKLDKKEIAKK